MSTLLFRTLLLVGVILAVSSAGDRPVVFDRDTVLDTSVFIPENVTCTIKAGVTIKFNGYHRFVVLGLLIAEGTKDRPIVITGVDRQRGSMEKPCWQGFEISGEKADAIFRFCRVEGAYRNLIYAAKPSIQSCEFAGNHCALYCSNKSAAYIKRNKIYRNKYGIIADYSSPMILDNIITDNVIGVMMMRSSRLVAGRNTISGNKEDIRSEESFGKNHDAVSLKNIWDLMNQLY